MRRDCPKCLSGWRRQRLRRTCRRRCRAGGGTRLRSTRRERSPELPACRCQGLRAPACRRGSTGSLPGAPIQLQAQGGRRWLARPARGRADAPPARLTSQPPPPRKPNQPMGRPNPDPGAAVGARPRPAVGSSFAPVAAPPRLARDAARPAAPRWLRPRGGLPGHRRGIAQHRLDRLAARQGVQARDEPCFQRRVHQPAFGSSAS